MPKFSAKTSITALVLVKNEATMLTNCLKTLGWCSQVIVLDDGSVDDSAKIAENMGAQVISFSHPSFARLREELLKRASSDYVFYVDADERVTPTLAKEIMVRTETNEADVFRVRRSNIYYGQSLEHGGWGDDILERVFLKSAITGWQGDIHESPIYQGKVADLTSPLLHLTHRDTVSGLIKSAAWTPLEAVALVEANAAPVTRFTIIRKGVMEFVRRYFLKRGYRDGMVGFVESVVQAINRVLVYLQVWEKQQKPPIAQKYQELEAEIIQTWLEDK